ncbi:kinase-like domain-containing protein [Fimicolochytrium jonesii]|uniref:kinase-like domain-containing protein n=1 Tax=Fimicolochytrium jonesii TaxID=1396493 RepID=UPI0022FEE5AD|nr:kinase-like domain-containing protein [Fimicolochytrium jonesii]KAI8824952.1 kinase-like domain-containing protein [Fimicolochytrium jonesii]
MQELRLSFAEPADISQVVDIHNFDVNEEECSTGVAAPIPKKVGLADFEFVSVVGQGAYGKVFLVRKKKVSPNVKSELYAMKVLKKASIVLHGKDAEHTRNERSILEDVRHPFIVTLHYAFQTASKLYLILGYASGGELFTYLSKERMFAEDVACFYVAELLLALEHLHDLGIIYRDLKPENVLLNANGHVLLTDFGLSKVALDAQTVCGTIEFMAPEVLDDHRKGGYEKAVDYWSLGVMLFDMLTGSPPFTGHNRRKIMDGILKKKVVWPKYLTPQARDLCNKLLQKNPSKRLGGGMYGAAMVQKHPFFRKVDWQKLAALEVEPPLVPTLTNPEDISHFDECFTSMPIGDSPAELGIGQANPGAEADPFEHFVGFSYVAEHQYM